MYTISSLSALSLEELRALSKKMKVEFTEDTDSKSLIYKILDIQATNSLQAQSSSKKTQSSKTKSRKATTPKEEKKIAPPEEKHENTKKAVKTKEEITQNTGATNTKNTKGGARNTRQGHKQNAHNKKGGRKKEIKKTPLASFDGSIKGMGVLELTSSGYGFLRSADFFYLSSPDDVYVGHDFVKKFNLKTGDSIVCTLKAPKQGDRYFAIHEIIEINGCAPEDIRDRVNFEHLTPLFPDEKFNVVEKPTNYAARILDLFAPIGKGQRGMIVAPPKAGKTHLLKEVASGIAKNHPDVYMIILLLDERPEEVTDMMRSVNAEVIASTFDAHADNHVKVANLVLEKSKRMVEAGLDVVIILDGITRLARAYNNITKSSGRILSGGIDSNAIYPPKKFFGAARNVENGGSLTILATALIETGSKMDEGFFEEFKGTGNMELKLDRRLANRGLFPAIDVAESSTRRNELLQSNEMARRLKILRHAIADMKPHEALEMLLNNMKNTHDNEEFLKTMHN